jgi:flagellar assembly protein FliH
MTSSALPSHHDTPRVIKARAAEGIGTPVAFNYKDLEVACHEQFAVVQEQSQQLLEHTQNEANRLRREALDAGRKAGYQDGIKSAETHIAERVDRLATERLAQQLETVLPAVRQLAEQLVREQERWIARWEHDAVRLAVAIAEKLLHRTLAADPSAADAIIAETLRVAAGTPVVKVRMSPLDVERLGANVERLNATVGRLGEAQIVADANISPGGCLIETQHGHIDGRLDTMLERIASELCDDSVSNSSSVPAVSSS